MRALADAFTRKVARLRDDVAGASAVEFAFLLPIMILLFVGGAIWTEGITIKRKVQLVSRTVGDLVAQDISITNAEMTTIFTAADAVVQPYNASNLLVIVSCVAIDANGNAKIGWSDSHPAGSALAINSPVTLPWSASVLKNTMNMANTKLVWSEARYDYTPPVKFTLFSSSNSGMITLKDQTYFRQRTGSTMTRDVTNC
jgi:Flp pilus assembly protein TadG